MKVDYGINSQVRLFVLDMETGEMEYLAGDVLLGSKQDIAYATEIFRIDPSTGGETQLTFTNRNIYGHIKVPGVEERWNYQLMAAHDYIVVAPNRRGLPTFGHEWNLQISTDYGGQNMKDYLSAIDALSAEPYVDEKRLGAIGASYGGYSTFYLEGIHEGRFKTFISHCGIFNLESMYTATEETFFVNFDNGGAYWEKPTPRNYRFSPHRYVQNWDTPILIITGENDLRVPYTQSLEAFNAARLRGIPSRLLVFPGETHFVTRPQNAILWQREFFGWLDKWLK